MWNLEKLYQFSSVQSLSCVRLFVTPGIAACQASLSITNSRSLLKLMSIGSKNGIGDLICKAEIEADIDCFYFKCLEEMGIWSDYKIFLAILDDPY